MSREVSPEEIAQLEELAKKATPGPWATSEDMDEIWGDLSGSQVKRVLSVKHPVTAPNLAFIEYANPERILRLLSTRCRGEGREKEEEGGIERGEPYDSQGRTRKLD